MESAALRRSNRLKSYPTNQEKKNEISEIRRKKGIDSLKCRLANNEVSVRSFYRSYFKPFSVLTYREFCRQINWFESETPQLMKAIKYFWKYSND